MKQLDLRELTEAERRTRVNEVVAEIAGWAKIRRTIRGAGAPERGPSPYGFPPGKNYECSVPPYATSADAVLPLLAQCREWESIYHKGGRYAVHFQDGDIFGAAETFPLAACIALLRAHRIEVLT